MITDYDYVIRMLNLDKDEINWLSLGSSITKSKKAWQQFKTPDEICDQMTDLYKDKYHNQQKILVLFNVELIKSIYNNYENIIYKNLYFVADTQEKYNFVKCSFPKINISVLENHNIEELEKCVEVYNVKKFDVVFSNPPYTKNIDLKILKSLFNVAKSIIFVHPMGFLFDKKNLEKLYTDIKNSNFLESVTTFWGNHIFNIKSFLPVGITKWNTNKSDDECIFNSVKMKINDISFYDKKYFNEIKELKNKIKSYLSIFDKRNISNDVSNFSIKFSQVRGHIQKLGGWNNDFFSMITLGNENFVDSTVSYPEHIKDKQKLLWSFETENERKNFVKYCKSKFARFCLSFRKVGNHLDNTEICEIPWMDFTQEWNDANLCKEFGISEELWNYINKFIPDYYDDYKSGF